MAKKDEKAAALAAAQGSGAVFQLDEDEAVAAEPKHDDSGAKAQMRDKPAPRVEAVTKPDAAPRTDPISQIKDTMTMNAQSFAPAVEAATAKMRGMFDTAGAQVAAFNGNAMDGKVVERTQRMAQEAAELAKGNLEAMAASARIAAQNAGTIGQEAAAFGRKSFEGASEAMKSFASAKSPVELLRLQSKFAKTYLETMIAEGTRMSETMVKLAGEALEPVQTQFAANAEKVKSLGN